MKFSPGSSRSQIHIKGKIHKEREGLNLVQAKNLNLRQLERQSNHKSFTKEWCNLRKFMRQFQKRSWGKDKGQRWRSMGMECSTITPSMQTKLQWLESSLALAVSESWILVSCSAFHSPFVYAASALLAYPELVLENIHFSFIVFMKQAFGNQIICFISLN